MLYREGKTRVVQNDGELQDMLAQGWSKAPAAAPSVELNLGGELSAEMRAEAAAIDAQLRQPSVADLLRKIETLEARLAFAPKSELIEEQKRSKRSADAASAARARWEKRKQAGAGTNDYRLFVKRISRTHQINPSYPLPLKI